MIHGPGVCLLLAVMLVISCRFARHRAATGGAFCGLLYFDRSGQSFFFQPGGFHAQPLSGSP